MERLTQRTENGTAIYTIPNEDPVDWANNRYNVLEKLAEYEDLEESGRLVRLPCKTGTSVYIVRKCLAPSCKTCGGFAREGNCYTDSKARLFEGKFCLSFVDEIGKTVFLTREEAEAKLKEMEAEQ